MFRDARPSRPGARPATVLLIVVVAAPGGFQWRLLSAAVAVPSGSIAPSNGRSRGRCRTAALGQSSTFARSSQTDPSRTFKSLESGQSARQKAIAQAANALLSSATPRRNYFAVVIDVGQMLNGVLGVESVRLPQLLPRSNAVTRQPPSLYGLLV